MNAKNQSCNMTLNGLELNAFLGWPEEERIQQQAVRIDIQIEFDSPPRACLNDSLSDTVCYDTLIRLIKNIVATKSFRLIEHLTHEIYLGIKTTISQSAKISVRVKKTPPIPELTGGAVFCVGD